MFNVKVFIQLHLIFEPKTQSGFWWSCCYFIFSVTRNPSKVCNQLIIIKRFSFGLDLFLCISHYPYKLRLYAYDEHLRKWRSCFLFKVFDIFLLVSMLKKQIRKSFLQCFGRIRANINICFDIISYVSSKKNSFMFWWFAVYA